MSTLDVVLATTFTIAVTKYRMLYRQWKSFRFHYRRRRFRHFRRFLFEADLMLIKSRNVNIVTYPLRIQTSCNRHKSSIFYVSSTFRRRSCGL